MIVFLQILFIIFSMLIKSSKVRRRIIYGIMRFSMSLFFIVSALNHITVEKCKKLNLPILYIVTENNKRISKKKLMFLRIMFWMNIMESARFADMEILPG